MKSEKLNWGAAQLKTKQGPVSSPVSVISEEITKKDGSKETVSKTVPRLAMEIEIPKPENFDEMVSVCGGNADAAFATFWYGHKLQWQGWLRNVAQGVVNKLADESLNDRVLADAGQYGTFCELAVDSALEEIKAQLAKGFGPHNPKPREASANGGGAVRLSAKLQGAVKNAVGAGLDDSVIHAILDSEFTAEKVSAAITAARG